MLPKDQVALAMRETVSRAQLERKPQQDFARPATRVDLEQTHNASLRALAGIFHFNALAISRLVPQGGMLLDLGSGSAAFLCYLAQRRPDLQIIGVEESPDLLNLGQAYVANLGLEERVSLNAGSPTFFAERIPARIDMITSVLSANRLASSADLLKMLQESLLVRIRCGCAVWFFDYSRPNLAKTAEEFPATLLPGAPVQFRWDVRNALLSAFTAGEVIEAFDKVSFGTVMHALSNNLKLFQAHWIEREDGQAAAAETLWREGSIPTPAVAQFKAISSIFPKVPLPPHLK
jgi:hypothetical protein